ncbi:MAG: hypothetical protein HY200_02635 [Nitrospirae bacterium]|nr:hypothetical protein [Nitrospirota bacterium]MBI3593833.1 hypothetical protein [Nitrospirota bacterium]
MSLAFKRIGSLGLLLITLINTTGCGKTSQAATSSLQGVFIDANTIAFLQQKFDEAKTCAQLPKGNFSDLSIIMMPPSFTCPYYTSGCSGEFDEPNLVKIGTFSSWKHEVIHYLIYVNTGDPDTNHTSSLFQTCTT